MVRTYAVVMALLGMNVVTLRAIKDGGGVDGTISSAFVWMTILCGVGAVVAWIARETVDESVRLKIETELAAATEPHQVNGEVTATTA